MKTDTDVVIVGGGIIGLAAAAALAQAGRSVVLLERNAGFGQETTARNSEVIHAGIYYPEGSLKAELCSAGREALYARCAEQRIPHRKLGKIIVAGEPGELETLERLQRLGTANGVPGLELLDARAVRRREPAVRVAAALLSPSTGIVDAHALCLSFAAEAERHGAVLVPRSEVTGLEPAAGGYRAAVRGPEGEPSAIRCSAVVNAAGLGSDALAELAGFDLEACGYRLHPCKGDYFALAPSAPVRISGLIYPVPGRSGLGIHATPDLGGRIRFGPDTEYVDRVHFDVDPRKAEAFAAAVRRFLPEIQADWLSPDFAGVRPKLAGPEQAFRDFVVREESSAGYPGFVNLIGIDSPGLTAAPAIAARVVALLRSL